MKGKTAVFVFGFVCVIVFVVVFGPRRDSNTNTNSTTHTDSKTKTKTTSWLSFRSAPAPPVRPDEEAPRNIVGRVEDAQTHLPIVAASVLLEVDGVDLGETSTLEDGTFGVPLQTYERVWARVRAEGYAPASANCFDGARCTIGLDRGVSISGKVLDADLAPLGGARVSCRAGHEEHRAETVSAADGSFALAVCPIHWLQVVAESPGHATTVMNAEGYGHGDRVEMTIVLRSGSPVRGVVRDGDGPGGGVEVLALPPNERTASVRTTSGADGRFDLGSLPLGSWTVAAFDADGRMVSREVRLDTTTAREIELPLADPATLAGTVWVDGVPVSGAALALRFCRPSADALPLARVRERFWVQRHGAQPEWKGSSGPDGTFRLATGGPAECSLIVAHPEAGHRTMRVNADAQEIDVHLERGHRLQGVVHGADGRLADVEGTAHVLAEREVVPGPRAQAKAPIRHGAFDAGRLPPGRYVVKAQLTALTGPPPLRVEIAGADVQVVLVRPGGTVKGRVVDEITAAPVAAAHVDVGGFMKDGAKVEIPVTLVKSDADGRFTIEGADPTMWIKVHRPGYETATHVTFEELVPGGTLDIGDIPVRR